MSNEYRACNLKLLCVNLWNFFSIRNSIPSSMSAMLCKRRPCDSVSAGHLYEPMPQACLLEIHMHFKETVILNHCKLVTYWHRVYTIYTPTSYACTTHTLTNTACIQHIYAPKHTMYNGNNTSYRPYTKMFFLFPLRALGTHLGNHKSIVVYSIYGPFIVIWRFCGLLYARVTEMEVRVLPYFPYLQL